MKSCFWVIGLFLSSWMLGAPTPKQPEYNINVHVTESRIVKHSESSARYQYLDVTINGKRYELESVLGVGTLLELGDYKARLSTDDHENGGYDLRQVYEFQFPDRRTREFLVVGHLE